MPNPALLIAAISFVIWLYLLVARGNFWILRPFDDDEAAPPAPPTWPAVTAIVPARNESETIAQAIASLAQQNYGGKFSIVVVDDHSEDNTAKLAQESAQTRRHSADQPAGAGGHGLPGAARRRAGGCALLSS